MPARLARACGVRSAGLAVPPGTISARGSVLPPPAGEGGAGVLLKLRSAG